MALNLGKAVLDFLTAHPDEKFSARQIAEWIFAIFPELQDGSVRPTARVLTSGRLGRKLVVRHAQNDKPLVS